MRRLFRYRPSPACLAVLLCLLVPIPARAAPPKGKKYALLVGVKNYDGASFSPLKYTENDVEELARILNRSGSGFAEVRVLTSTRGKKNKAQAPTAGNIRAAFAKLIAGRGRHDTVLIALSGHGIQLDVKDPKGEGGPKSYGYFCPANADLVGVKYRTGHSKRLILVDELLEELGRCNAGARLVLMDACRSEEEVKGSRNVDVDRVSIPRGVAVLFSCSRGQKAFETKKLGKGHGVFFFHVIEGLKGKAKDEDGEVDWASLSRHVTRQVLLEVPKLIGGGAEQTPHEVKNLAGRPVLLAAAAGLPTPEQVCRRGLVLLQGRGEPIDEQRAVKHFQQAAQAGHALARAELALCCWLGEGTDRDSALALLHVRPALAAVKEAAGKGDANAQYALAGLYRFGVEVVKDEKEAFRWYSKAAAQGHVAAMTGLAKLYREGRGVAKDSKKAVEWWRKAADKGHPAAMTDLGVMYATGEGVAEDSEEAVAWYTKAAERAHPRAMKNLGLCHEKGWGVDRDKKEALRWYRKAAALGNARARAAVKRLEE